MCVIYLLIGEKGGCSEGQKYLIIPKKLPEDVNHRRTDNRMAKIKRTKTIYKT